MESSGNGNGDNPGAPRPLPRTVIYDFSESENDEEEGQLLIPSVQPLPTSPFLRTQFRPRTRNFFPVPGQGFDLKERPHLPQETALLETTISEMNADLGRYASPAHSSPQSPRDFNVMSPRPAYVSPLARANRRSSLGARQSDTPPCTSISMLIHSSMERPSHQDSPWEKRRMRTPFTTLQRMQEKVYDSLGEKPSNLADENQLLYQTLDSERKRLILRKGLCSFMYGALKRQGAKLELLEAQHNVKREECAARLIFHTLLLQTYRKVQEQLTQLTSENNQLKKSVENLCLQLRVVRHLQSAEKERVVEKIHEIGNLKTELNYVKKVLSKNRTDLQEVEQECQALEHQNGELAEDKYKMQREVRILQEKKEILQGSLEMEKKRTEKHTTTAKELKRQVVDLRQQISELTKQCDEWDQKSKGFEAMNFELQVLLESRGKEVIELGKNRDSLKAQKEEMEKETMELQAKNENLAVEIKKQGKVSQKLMKSLDGAEAQLCQQTVRIGYLEGEIGRITRESVSMRTELATYQLRNIRRRRSWVNLVWTVADPLGTICRLFLGRPNEFIAWN